MPPSRKRTQEPIGLPHAIKQCRHNWKHIRPNYILNFPTTWGDDIMHTLHAALSALETCYEQHYQYD